MKIKDEKFIDIRDRIAGFIDDILVGPLYGDNEVLDISPLNYYTSGILYPQRKIINYDTVNNIEEAPRDEEIIGAEESLHENILPQSIEEARNLSQRTLLESSKEYDSNVNDELALTSEFKPSAFGISVIVGIKSSFSVKVKAAKYDKQEVTTKEESSEGKKSSKERKKYTYSRIEINKEFILAINKKDITLTTNGKHETHVNRITYALEKTLELHITKRNFNQNNRDKFVITLTLVHTDTVTEYKNDASEYYFQPEITVYSEEPVFLPNEDLTDLKSLSNDELNNKLLYRKYLSFGTGHGASVKWNDLYEFNDKKKIVSSVIIPRYEVMNNDFEPEELIQRDSDGKLAEDCEILYIKRLAGESFISKKNKEPAVSKDNMVKELKDFVNVYSKWVDNIEKESASIKEGLISTAKRNISDCRKLINRMKKGIFLIETDTLVYDAFKDANKAMFMQRIMTGFSKKRAKEHGELFPGDNDEILPNFEEDFKYNEEDKDFTAKWRPFQLAFFLSQIEGIIDPKSEDRDTTDLIWFTTGGGKTEAYLGLTAFTIFYRRLREKANPDNGAGVTVIMRYTLRLLNKQQFNRSLPLICSCELIRRKNKSKYGNKEISVGIWVGGSLTPNRWDQFQKSFSSLTYNSEKKVEFTLPIISCPCCGTKLIKSGKKGEWGCLGKNHRGKENPPYHITCRNKKCEFYISNEEHNNNDFRNHLPIYFVDEEIYKPDILPTLLFSTVDKFASLPWKKESFSLFNLKIEDAGKGSEVKNLYPGPELIIQDELHLISSALGTVYGIYETAIDMLCSNAGPKPKVVAATATARNAETQCRFLFARKHYSQFPPAGIDADDSFFSRKQRKFISEKDTENWGRLYLGFQPSGTTNTVAQIRLISLLMQMIPTIQVENKLIDYYYPIVVYFNTLKELGKFRTLLEDDIVAYRNFLSSKLGNYFIPFASERCNELSSAMKADDITSSLENLEKCKLKDINTDDAVKLIFSKGVRQFADISKYLIYEKDERKCLNFRRLFNNPETFKKLGIDFDENNVKNNFDAFATKAKEIIGEEESMDVSNIISATNMISVGIDISRFNIMQITGQPKSHSEYIQASSRVSREKPGIVITTANPSKNRDRSHYERFVDYHQTFYKYVESSSVTPFSLPALEKVLPAVLISLMHMFSFKLVKDANIKGHEEYFEDLASSIAKRIKYLCDNSSEISDLERDEYITNFKFVKESIFSQWKDLSDDIKKLIFSGYEHYFLHGKEGKPDPDKIHNALFIQPQFKELFPAWANKLTCMTSMRTVENSSIVKIKQ